MEKTIKKDSIYYRFMDSKFVATIRKIVASLSSKKWFSYIVFLYVVCFTMFLYTLTKNSFTIPVSGDFTLQEIPFYFNGYDDWWHALTTGEFVFWDDSAMLGVNNIGANSFYYLFNPFFLVLLIVPRAWLPQAQAFMMITKMVLAGVSMKLLLEHFKLKEETTWLVGTTYAFCGWNLYYLWFNHFLEIAVLMPLVLLGIEKIIKEQKPKMLILVLFISGLTNYFFLISFCFCGVMYAIFRFFQNWKAYRLIMKEEDDRVIDIRWEVILKGIFAFSCGLMLTAVILFPCFSVALNNTRVTSQTYLTSLTEASKNLIDAIKGTGEFTFNEAFKAMWDVLFKWANNGQKYILYPLIAFFTPNVTCFDSLIFNNVSYDNAYASLFIYTPLLLYFVPSVIQALKSRKVSTILGLLGLGVLLFTPFAYYCFSGFTSVAYARWYIFVTAVSCVFIACQYDKKEEMSVWYLDISFGIIVFFYGFLIYKGEYLLTVDTISNIKELDERVYYIYGELIYILLMYLYIRKNFKKPDLTHNLRYFVAFEAIVMCNITLVGQGTANYQGLYQGEANIKEEMNIAQTIKQEDDDYYRVFSTTCDRNGNNLAMMLGTSGLGTFHSVYNYELDDFLNWSTVKYNGSWSMGIHEKRINLDEFLGVKYYILKKNDNNVPFGFTEYLSTDNHTVYVNDNYIQLGFAYDNIVSSSLMREAYQYNFDYEGDQTSDGTLANENAYLKGAVLYDEDIEEIFGKDYTFDGDYTLLDKTAIKEGLTTVSATRKNTKVYKAIWENGAFVGYEDPVSYSTTNTTALTWNSYISEDVKGLGIAKNASKDNRCYVAVQARMGENLGITLYGENDLGEEYVLASDRHMTHWYAKSNYEWKRQRGFYVDDEVTRIEVRVYETMGKNNYLLKPIVTYQYEDSYNQNIAQLKKNALQNPYVGTNTASFDTNYEDSKYVVLQIPYDAGWSLKVTDDKGNKVEAPKIYKGQGGFISFKVEKGNYHYELSYMTPYLENGVDVMIAGMFVYGCYYIASYYLDISEKRYYQIYIKPFQKENIYSKKNKKIRKRKIPS